MSSVLRLIQVGVMRLAFLAGRPSKIVVVPCSQGGRTVVVAGAGGALHETDSVTGAAGTEASVVTCSVGRMYTSPSSPEPKRTKDKYPSVEETTRDCPSADQTAFVKLA
mgnify:CR=1 FL=1